MSIGRGFSVHCRASDVMLHLFTVAVVCDGIVSVTEVGIWVDGVPGVCCLPVLHSVCHKWGVSL